jgi:Leu/Phe-tRNA-protein transferase
MGWPLIDAQVENPHLVSLGAESWPRTEFLAQVDGLVRQPESLGNWTLRFGLLEARQLAEVNGG